MSRLALALLHLRPFFVNLVTLVTCPCLALSGKKILVVTGPSAIIQSGIMQTITFM